MTARARLANAGGQAVAEFGLTFIVFVLLLMAVFDLGRAVYAFNGVSEAAREIARRTSVYPGPVLGQTNESQDAVAVQMALVPGMQAPVFRCVGVDGVPNSHDPCQHGDYVEVTVSASYSPIAPLPVGPITLTSTTTMIIP